MEKLLNLTVNFGVAGFVDGVSHDKVYSVVDRLMHEFLAYADIYNTKEYGFSGNEIRCNVYTCGEFSNNALRQLSDINGYTYNTITSADSVLEDGANVISLNIKKENLGYINTISEYMVNKSDVVFLLWDGEQSFQDGAIWAILQFCKQKSIPCYLINTKDIGDISFSFDSHYAAYDKKLVKKYTEKLYAHPATGEDKKEKKVFLSKLWVKLYRRYLKKFNVKVEKKDSCETAVSSQEPPVEEDSAQYRNYLLLKEYYEYYDAKAVKASSMYRASIYFRSIMPFIASVFIAIGFYADPIFKLPFGSAFVLGINIWSILAGLGFLAHALINLYSVYAAKHPTVVNYHREFIESRFIAEYLRIAIQGEPYGIQLHGNLWKNNAVDNRVVAKLQNILRQLEPASCVQTSEKMANLVSDLEKTVQEQIDYHESCVKRYEAISSRLTKASKIMYIVSAVVVIARGFLQFAIPYLADVLDLTTKIHEVEIGSFTKSFANMVALMVPAWASYYSSKLSMNSFEWLKSNSERHKQKFSDIREKIHSMGTNKDYSYQIVEDIMGDVETCVEEDVTGWYYRIGAQKFTRI